MINLEELKRQALSPFQIILFESDGSFIDSCDTIESTGLLPGENIIPHDSFLESLDGTYQGLINSNETLEFHTVEMNFFGKTGIFDIKLKFLSNYKNHENVFAYYLFDYSEWYESARKIQQLKNASSLEIEVAQLNRHQIELEKQLLALKNEELQNSKRYQEIIIGKLAHEMRNPLNGVLGILKILTDEYDNILPEKYRLALTSLSGNLANSFNDLIDFAKIEAGEISFARIAFNPHEVLESVIYSHTFDARQKGISLVLKAETEIPDYLIGDPSRLTQIVSNLVSNGIKYSYKGTVNLSYSFEEKRGSGLLNIKVADTGTGIPRNMLNKLFKPFHTTLSADNVSGKGFGLSIVHNLVTLQKGSVSVESFLKKGTVFDLTIPYDIADSSQGKSSKISGRPYPGDERVNALIIEDDAVNQLVIQKFLEEGDIKVCMAENSEEAIKLLEVQEFNLLILDYYFPGSHSKKLIEKIKEYRIQNLVPIILMSGTVESEKKSLYTSDYFLSKPYSQNTLDNALSEAVQLYDIWMDTNAALNKISQETDFQKQIFNSYMKESASLLTNFPKIIAQKDLEVLDQTVHKFKASTKLLNQVSLTSLLETIEEKIKTDEINWDVITPQIIKVQKLIRVNISRLRKFPWPEN